MTRNRPERPPNWISLIQCHGSARAYPAADIASSETTIDASKVLHRRSNGSDPEPLTVNIPQANCGACTKSRSA